MDAADGKVQFLAIPPSPETALSVLGDLVRRWFGQRFGEPTPAQRLAWPTVQTGQNLLLCAPTGSGKTHVAIGAIARTQLPTLCLVPTRVLLHQWRAALGASWGCSVGALGDGLRTVEVITVATFESAFRMMERIGHRFGLLIVDEAHHFGNGIRDEALEMCAAPARAYGRMQPPRRAVPGRSR